MVLSALGSMDSLIGQDIYFRSSTRWVFFLRVRADETAVRANVVKTLVEGALTVVVRVGVV